MFGCVIILKSITYAIKSEALLKKNGFSCRVVKPDGDSGCKYGIAISCINIKKATAVIASAGIPIEQILA